MSAALLLAAAAPGSAAPPLAEGTAVGLEITTGGQTNDSGRYRVVNDGTGARATGSSDPAITVLGNQSLVSAGTLAQNATAQVTGDEGASRACAGLAGDGASLVQAGEGDCLTPGNQLELEAANFDLSEVTLAEGEALEPLASEIDAALVEPLRSQVLDAVDDDVAAALEQVGDPSVVLDLGAVQGSCTSDASGVTGDSSLAGASLFTVLPEQGRVDLVSFPVDPPPNTKLVTDLSVVVETFDAALQEQLSTGLEGALADLGPLADQALEQINANIVRELEPELAPLEENLLDVTLNEQASNGRSISVTALDLRALPAAEVASGTDLLSARIGAVTCDSAARTGGPGGPGGPGDDNPDGPPVVSPPGDNVPGGPGGPGGNNPGGPPDVAGPGGPGGPGTSVPTSVDSGLDGDDHALPIGLVVLLAVATGAGVYAYRRRLAA